MENICRPLISVLLGARDGSLWIGMEGGLSHWDKQHLTNYLITPEHITSVIEDLARRPLAASRLKADVVQGFGVALSTMKNLGIARTIKGIRT